MPITSDHHRKWRNSEDSLIQRWHDVTVKKVQFVTSKGSNLLLHTHPSTRPAYLYFFLYPSSALNVFSCVVLFFFFCFFSITYCRRVRGAINKARKQLQILKNKTVQWVRPKKNGYHRKKRVIKQKTRLFFFC